MPRSMTGFANSVLSTDSYEIEVRIKSLNGRGLELSLKGSKDILFFTEKDIRNLIKKYLERGSIQVYINIRYYQPKILENIDTLKNAVNSVYKMMEILNIQLTDDKVYELAVSLSNEFEKTVIDEETKNNIIKAFELALKQLVDERKKEGIKLVKDITSRLDKIEAFIKEIEIKKDELIDKVKNKTVERVKELLGENFSERAFIEATLLVDKMDITEEIVRLKSHIKRFRDFLQMEGSIGKKLDFLCQEMHREINTLGNKIPDFSNYTIEIKSEIEKIRQQVQNIE